jgi:hypothetical protein
LNIEGSVIQNNQTNAWAEGSAALDATSDWWGTAEQSSLTPLLAGNVSYTPFLTSEPVLTPAIGTSNGITQVGSPSVVLQLACRTATSMRLSEDFTFSNVFYVPFSNYATFALSAGGGLKHIFAEFRSVTGQTNSPVEVNVNYITAGPVIESFSLTDGETLNRPLTVTGSATAVLGMQDIEFYVDGVGLATNNGGSFSYYFDIRPLANATHQVELLARDTAGNIATLEEDVIVAVTPPLAPVITTPGGNYVTNNANITVKGTAEENINIQVSANGQVLGSTTTDASGNFSVSNATLVEGINAIVAVASDSTGSTASSARDVTVETIPPVAVIMSQPVYAPGVGLELSWTFASSGKQASTFELFWSTSPFTTTNQATGHSILLAGMSDIVQGLATGTYYFGVVGFDAAGNPSPLSGLVSSLFDATAPVLNIVYGAPSPVGPGALAVTVTSSEALAGTPVVTVQPAGAPSPVALVLTNVALNTWQSVFSVTPSTPSGMVSVLATAQDQVGNVFNGPPNGPQLIIDTTPPAATVVTAPPGPIQTISATNVSVSLTLSEPPGTGLTPSLGFNPPQGASVSLTLTGAGTNWVATLALSSSMGSGFGQFVFSATDSLGNVGTNISSGSELELYNTALPSPPASPTNLTATSLPGGYIELSWNAVGNAQIYRLYREAGTNFTLPATLDIDNITSTTVTDLPPADGLYSYGISSSRLNSESAISNVVIGLSDRTPPLAPTNVQVQLAATGVQITWQEPTGGQTPDHYNVYRNGTLIQTVPVVLPVTDYPPRGSNSYVVASVDFIGNENPSAPASIQLEVGPVNNLSALVVPGQAAVLSWTSTDSTVVGFNVYRNGIKQNASVITSTNYTDTLALSDAVIYGVSALNASAQESPQRTVTAHPVGLELRVNAGASGLSGPVLEDYFDQFQFGITNLSSSGNLPLAQVVLNRSVPGLSPFAVTQMVNGSIGAGLNLQQTVVVPEASLAGAQTVQMNVSQQTDSEGDSVTYQQTFVFTNSIVPSTEIAVSVNQLPLAGGLTPFQVQIFNRGAADIEFIVERANGQQPGDLYISVQNGSGQEASRTYFQGAPPGTLLLADGSGFVEIAAGSSITFTVPNVLVPAALAGSTNTTFVAVVSAIYHQIGAPNQIASGPLTGSMVSSLALPPYYGTAQTDKSVYINNDPVIITGQALSQTNGRPLPNAALTIGFSTRGFVWTESVTTDTNGNYQYVYNPPPGLGGTLNIWAANPLVVDQLNQAEIMIDRVYANPATGDIEMSKNGTFNFSIQLINPGDTALAGFTTTFNAYAVSGTNLVPISTITGTNVTGSGFTIAAGQSQSINVELAAAINAPGTAQGVFTFTSDDGAVATFTATLNLYPAVPVLAVTQPPVGYLEVSVNTGSQISGQIIVANNGLDTLRGVTLVPPTNSWISVNLPTLTNGTIQLPDLPAGQSNSFTVVFSPPASQPLAFYQDTVTIQGTNLATPFQISVDAIVTSSQTGAMQFFVDDILGEPLTGASIRLDNTLISANVGPFLTDTNGLVTVSNLEIGSWSWQASAPGCSASSGTINVVADETGYQHARLNRSFVTINFTVVPVPFTDAYTIDVTETYQTFVPFPVLVVTPLMQQFNNVSPGFQATYSASVQNAGLIQMENCTIAGVQDGVVSYEPLITYIPLVLPQQSISVPYTIIYYGSNGPSPQGGVQGCLGAGISGAAFANPFFSAFAGVLQTSLGIWNSILNANGQCPTDGTLVALGAQAQANLYSLASSSGNGPGGGPGGAPSASAALAAYFGCLSGSSSPFQGGTSVGGYSLPPIPQQSGPSFQSTGGGCFVGDTRILMADGTSQPISEISTNDWVRSGQSKDNIAMVAEILTVESVRVREIRLRHIRGGVAPSVLATAEHLFWLDGKGWTSAKDLKPGDWLSSSEGKPLEIVENRPINNPKKVYTLRLEKDNAFYANDVLVHDVCGGSLPVTAGLTTEVSK